MRLALVSVLAVAAVALIPASASAATCKLPADGRGLGPTYLLALTTTKAGCGQGKAVVKAWHACATKRRADGRCATKVLGYRCSEKRVTGPTEFDAKATCVKGAARVRFTYTQFT